MSIVHYTYNKCVSSRVVSHVKGVSKRCSWTANKVFQKDLNKFIKELDLYLVHSFFQAIHQLELEIIYSKEQNKPHICLPIK